MPIWAPPVPDRRSIATIISRTMTTVTLRFRRAYFSDEHGQVQAYAIGKYILIGKMMKSNPVI